VHEAVIDSVTFARNLTDDVEWSPRTARAPSTTSSAAASRRRSPGATTINIPDTVGYACRTSSRPDRDARTACRTSTRRSLSVHCHNDLGLAVANSWRRCRPGPGRSSARSTASASAPATRAGGGRHGAAHPPRQLPYTTGIDTTEIMRASRLVSAITGFVGAAQQGDRRRQRLRPRIGIHQDGMLKNAQTYEIMTPRIGRPASPTLVMGKHSGRHAFKRS
jgi:2-isopropylmalate synthase